MEFKIRKEVLDYMRVWGGRIIKDLNENELAYAKIMEDPLLIDKVREVERDGLRAREYYLGMESFYKKYVEEKIDLSNKTREECRNFFIELHKDYRELVGGGGVGF